MQKIKSDCFSKTAISLYGGQRTLWLNAYIGSVRPGHMPKPQIVHAGELYRNTPRVSGCFQSDPAARLLQHDCVIIEQAVRQRKKLISLQRKCLVYSIQKAVIRETDTPWVARGLKAQAVVLKLLSSPQRNPKAGMRTQAEIHDLLIAVLHLAGDGQTVALQFVNHPECERSEAHRLRDNHLRQSMPRKANCWDNAPQESFFGHMKDELVLAACSDYNNLLAHIDNWTDYYNNDRYQWNLALLSPN